nr:hypothetical protein [Actinomycetota bacterium]
GSAALMRGVGDGTLSVEDGNGRVVIVARGGVIGRFDSGSVTIQDRTPADSFDAKVWGAPRDRIVGDASERYFGTNVRFRLIGGEFRIVIVGRGIDVSVVGNGTVILRGDGKAPGVFSFEGEDCSSPRAKCRELPELPRTFSLGTDAGSPSRIVP